jgi:hypothetical protein
MKRSSIVLIGGGVGAVFAAWFASRKSDETTDDILQALSEEPLAPGAVPPSKIVKVRATGYWPYSARPDERKMEGGLNDRKGKPIITLEMHQRDPSRYPYVSVSGDDAIWPYGQRIDVDAWPGSVFRVVDTGSHFRGIKKIYRVAGYEPLDIAVDSSQTKVPKLVSATIYPGDNFAKGKAVAAAGFKGQTVLSGEASRALDLWIDAYRTAVRSGDAAGARRYAAVLDGLKGEKTA